MSLNKDYRRPKLIPFFPVSRNENFLLVVHFENFKSAVHEPISLKFGPIVVRLGNFKSSFPFQSYSLLSTGSGNNFSPLICPLVKVKQTHV